MGATHQTRTNRGSVYFSQCNSYVHLLTPFLKREFCAFILVVNFDASIFVQIDDLIV